MSGKCMVLSIRDKMLKDRAHVASKLNIEKDYLNIQAGVGDIAKRLRILVALAENLGSVFQ